MSAPAPPSTCRDCRVAIDPTNATVPTLCPACYETRRARILAELRTLAEDGDVNFDAMLDQIRHRLLDLGVVPETAERSLDRMRVSALLGLPWESVENR